MKFPILQLKVRRRHVTSCFLHVFSCKHVTVYQVMMQLFLFHFKVYILSELVKKEINLKEMLMIHQ